MKKMVIAISATIAMIALVVVAVHVTRGHGEYTVIVSADGAVLVNRTDTKARSGPFNLRNSVAPGTYRLGSEDDSKGVYTVTFHDSTMRPGRFTLTIGGSVLDIMPARTVFDQKEVNWEH